MRYFPSLTIIRAAVDESMRDTWFLPRASDRSNWRVLESAISLVLYTLGLFLDLEVLSSAAANAAYLGCSFAGLAESLGSAGFSHFTKHAR